VPDLPPEPEPVPPEPEQAPAAVVPVQHAQAAVAAEHAAPVPIEELAHAPPQCCAPSAVDPRPQTSPPAPALVSAAPSPTRTVGLAPEGAVLGGYLLWRLLGALRLRRPVGKEAEGSSGLHPRARRLLDAILVQPGVSLRRLRAGTGLANGVALHHLARLLDGGHVVAHRHRNALLFFENHGRYSTSWRAVAALADEGNRRLHAWLAANPQAKQAQVVDAGRAWGWRRSAVQKRLALLEEAGLVERRREGRVVRHTALAVDDPRGPAAAAELPASASAAAAPAPGPWVRGSGEGFV